ncbi:MAG: hypothetical protein Aurels2KO_23070 [Aureliella sp.]
MRNLSDPRALYLKGGLFVVLGTIAAALLIARMPSVGSACLLAIAVWAFCRAYYFAFYVIEHYVDPSFRFAGLIDFARYALLGKRPDQRDV